jgi:predicted RNA-binding Zn-ribbon protein involved in translation (DUF1610 family)
MIGLAVLFLIPIYYLAKSKGYNALGVCIASGLFGLVSPFVLHFATGMPVLPFSDCTLALAALFVVWLLPARKGAPGKAYLKITFNCPECGASVTFERQEEGAVALCPACGEIVTVPLDEFSIRIRERGRRRPEPVDGKVCFDAYSSEMKALEVQALLEGNGIQSDVLADDGGGAFPYVGFSQGHRVIIKDEDWERAIDIEQEVNKPLETPSPGAPQD